MKTLEEIKAYHNKWSEEQIIGIMGKQYLTDMGTLFGVLNGSVHPSKMIGVEFRYLDQARCHVQTIRSIDFLSNMHYLLELIQK